MYKSLLKLEEVENKRKMSLLSERRALYTRKSTAMRVIPESQRRRVSVSTRTRGINLGTRLTSMRSLLSGTAARSVTNRRIITARMRSRPDVTMRSRPGVTIRPRPGINIRDVIPTILPTVTAAPLSTQPGGGGLPSPSVTGGGIGLGLDETIGDIKAFGGNIIDQFKTLVPTAIKIIAAVVIIKIVLFLIRGRRR